MRENTVTKDSMFISTSEHFTQTMDYYNQEGPKSLGREWVETQIYPLLEKYGLSLEDMLRTFYEHGLGLHRGENDWTCRTFIRKRRHLYYTEILWNHSSCHLRKVIYG